MEHRYSRAQYKGSSSVRYVWPFKEMQVGDTFCVDEFLAPKALAAMRYYRDHCVPRRWFKYERCGVEGFVITRTL